LRQLDLGRQAELKTSFISQLIDLQKIALHHLGLSWLEQKLVLRSQVVNIGDLGSQN
jgi:hypothetical protein